MYIVRSMVSLGLQGRANAGIKIRQPLGPPVIDLQRGFSSTGFKTILEEELNVKGATYRIVGPKGTNKITMELEITPDLETEGIMRELIRQIQNARKKAGLNVEDRIHLKIESDSAQITEAVKKFKDTIFTETLATAELKGKGSYSETVKVEGQDVKISLARTQDTGNRE